MIPLAELSRYDLLAAALQAVVVVGALATAVVYAAKRSGNRSSNVFFALLLTSFALSISALVLEHLGLPARHPRLRYVPLWFTWTIGPAWFFYVKFSLFPAYRFRWSDLKHFVAPSVQVLTYAVVFFGRLLDGRQGPVRVAGVPATTIEEVVFLASVGGYILAAYRYLRYRAREIGPRRLRWDYWKVALLRRSQRVLVVLLALNFGFVAYNFVVEQASGFGLEHVRGFYASSSLTFGLILVSLLRGVAYRQHFYPQVPPAELAAEAGDPGKRLEILLVGERGFRDPDLHRVRAARAVGAPPQRLDDLARARGASSWWAYVLHLRAAEVARLRKTGLNLRAACLQAGFASQQAALRALRRRGSPLEHEG